MAASNRRSKQVIPNEEKVLRAVEAIADEMVAFLQCLIRIPTVNPPGREYRAAAEWIGAKLKEFEYDVEYVAAEGRPEHTRENPRVNVIGRMPGCAQRPLLHFNGHFDVVPVGAGWTVDPFAALLRDGKIYGRGTADQKAGIAASIYAVEAIRRSGIKLQGTVELSGTVDEESGGFAGVAYLAERGFIHRDRTDFVIITEPSNVDRICIGHRGVYWFKVIQHGRIAHGSMPHFGVSAADHLGDLIHEINHTLKPRLATRKTAMPVEPPGSRHPSININSVFGGQPEEGTQTPCVIDRAGAIFDRRFLAEEPFTEVRQEIHDLLENLQVRNAAVRYDVEDLMIVHPTQTDSSSTLVRVVSACVETILGKNPPLIASPGTYDQKHVTRIGLVLECIAYGPGILDLAHQPDEYVVVEDVINAAKVMALACMQLLS
jgi:succinyl-diaminopimelate desuccinylase